MNIPPKYVCWVNTLPVFFPLKPFLFCYFIRFQRRQIPVPSWQADCNPFLKTFNLGKLAYIKIKAKKKINKYPYFYYTDLAIVLDVGLPGCSVGKESACNAGDLGLIPGSGRSPEEGNGNPLQYSCLENPMDREAWRATVHGVTRVGHNLATKPPNSWCVFILNFLLLQVKIVGLAGRERGAKIIYILCKVFRLRTKIHSLNKY